jgi:hypothetical protein
MARRLQVPGVIIEAKKPTNKAEMVTKDKIKVIV